MKKGEFKIGTPAQFWAMVTVGGPNECWEWQGQRERFGHGKLRYRGLSDRAHRIAYVLINGSILPGQCVCHSCDNPPCCNGAHHFLGTRGDNFRDMHRKGRRIPANSRKTHCIHGHEFTPENTRIEAGNKRKCRACDLRRGMARYHRIRRRNAMMESATTLTETVPVLRRRKLGPAAIDTLDRAAAFAREHGADAWFRPKDVGGARGNNVGSYLTSLRERGLIWRREAKPSEWRELKMWEYRITAAGWAAKEVK